MTNLLFTLLGAAPAASNTQQQADSPSMMPTIIMMVVLFAIVYFFMIRPQSKKQKEIQKFRNALSVKQEVVTIGGLHGVIVNIDEAKNTVTLEVDKGTKLTFDKSAIMPQGSAPAQR